MSKPGSCAEAALYELCVEYGYCSAGQQVEQLLANTVDDPDAYADAVLAAEGIEPSVVGDDARREVREVICDWLFDDGQGRGTTSGLPRFPSAA